MNMLLNKCHIVFNNLIPVTAQSCRSYLGRRYVPFLAGNSSNDRRSICIPAAVYDSTQHSPEGWVGQMECASKTTLITARDSRIVPSLILEPLSSSQYKGLKAQHSPKHVFHRSQCVQHT